MARAASAIVHGTSAERGHAFLDAHYVAEHVQLGYAITAHRTQGATVNTSLVIVSPGMTREAFYVAMTRGRHGNKSYVVTEHDDRELEPHHQRDEEPPTEQQVLLNVLATEGTERSATEQMQQRLLEARPARRPQRTDELHGRHRDKLPTPVVATGIGVER